MLRADKYKGVMAYHPSLSEALLAGEFRRSPKTRYRHDMRRMERVYVIILGDYEVVTLEGDIDVI